MYIAYKNINSTYSYFTLDAKLETISYSKQKILKYYFKKADSREAYNTIYLPKLAPKGYLPEDHANTFILFNNDVNYLPANQIPGYIRIIDIFSTFETDPVFSFITPSSWAFKKANIFSTERIDDISGLSKKERYTIQLIYNLIDHTIPVARNKDLCIELSKIPIFVDHLKSIAETVNSETYYEGIFKKTEISNLILLETRLKNATFLLKTALNGIDFKIKDVKHGVKEKIEILAQDMLKAHSTFLTALEEYQDENTTF